MTTSDSKEPFDSDELSDLAKTLQDLFAQEEDDGKDSDDLKEDSTTNSQQDLATSSSSPSDSGELATSDSLQDSGELAHEKESTQEKEESTKYQVASSSPSESTQDKFISVSETLMNEWNYSSESQVSIQNNVLVELVAQQQQQREVEVIVSQSKPQKKWLGKWFARSRTEAKTDDAAGSSTDAAGSQGVATTEAARSQGSYVRSPFSQEIHKVILPIAMVLTAFCTIGQVLLIVILQMRKAELSEFEKMMHHLLMITLTCGILGYIYVASRISLHLLTPSMPRYRQLAFAMDEVLSVPCGLFALGSMTLMFSTWFGITVIVGFAIIIVWRWLVVYMS